eukprot:TRINITY_DN8565_c0_g1_i3.p1 TRINITY_DN8565_c0_g1~~TRINITY_DN8565_c0_g1_i3.p1  ORF type:complete len:1076 (+),score=270.49 TRINITY_DN8565_c0_g1_i3:184-3228(+)
MEVGFQTKVQQEVSEMLRVFFEAVAPERVTEVEALSTNYTGNERELAAYLRSEFGPLEAIDVFDSLGKELEGRKAVLDRRLQDIDLIGSFLRRFFARYEPQDGATGEEKATDLTMAYRLREQWPQLAELLRETYPRALEIKELQNLSSADMGVGSTVGSLHAPTTTDVVDGSDNSGAATGNHVNPLEAPKRPLKKQKHGSQGAESEDNLTLPASPKLPTRREWLFTNARIARYYHHHKKSPAWFSIMREIFTSVVFRVHLMLCLAAAAICISIGCIHFMSFLTLRIFSSYRSGFLETLGMSCLFVTSMFAIVSLLTTVFKTLHQWCFMDDDVFFGDVDYAKKWEEKKEDFASYGYTTVPSNPPHYDLVHLLPPQYQVTVFALPTSKQFQREVYCMVIIFATLIVPVLYAVIYVSVLGENVFVSLAAFFEWWLGAGMTIHLVLWLHTWGLSIRSKYRAYALWAATTDVRYDHDTYLLSEWGADRRTVIINLGLVVALSLPALLMFWITAHSTIGVTVRWSIVLLVVVGLILIIREFVRDARYQRQLPYVVDILVFVLIVLGLVGTISLSPSAAVIFVVTVVVTQGLLLPHHARTVFHVRPSDVAKIVKMRMSKMHEDEIPLTLAEHHVEKSMQSIRKGDKMNKPHSIPDWLPCGRVFYAAASCCLDLPEPEDAEPHWTASWEYYGGRQDSRYANPARKVQLAVSPKVFLWFMVCFVVANAVMFGCAASLKDTLPSSKSELVVGDNVPAYPVCYRQWGGYGITDLAVLAQTAYVESYSDFVLHWKGRLQDAGVVLTGTSKFEKDSGEGSGDVVKWLHYKTVDEGADMVVVKSNFEGEYLMRDVDIWSDSIVLSVVSALVPFLRFFPSPFLEGWVTAAATLKRPLDGGDHPSHYLDPLLTYLTTLNATNLIVIGHSSNGGIAHLAGETLGVTSVAFAPPGTAYLYDKMKTKFSKQMTSIVPYDAFLPTIDLQAGALQYISCDAGSNVDCQQLKYTIKELADACVGGKSRVSLANLPL